MVQVKTCVKSVSRPVVGGNVISVTGPYETPDCGDQCNAPDSDAEMLRQIKFSRREGSNGSTSDDCNTIAAPNPPTTVQYFYGTAVAFAAFIPDLFVCPGDAICCIIHSNVRSVTGCDIRYAVHANGSSSTYYYVKQYQQLASHKMGEV